MYNVKRVGQLLTGYQVRQIFLQEKSCLNFCVCRVGWHFSYFLFFYVENQ